MAFACVYLLIYAFIHSFILINYVFLLSYTPFNLFFLIIK